MAIFKKQPKDAAPLLDWRACPKLTAALAQRAALVESLPALKADIDRLAAVASEKEAETKEAELDNLAANGVTDAQLAASQATLLEAKRALAVRVVAQRKLVADIDKLDAAIPDIEYRAKVTATANVQTAYLQVMKDMLMALESVPTLGAELTRLRDLAAVTHPYTLRDSERDTRFPMLAALPLIAESTRVIRHSYSNQPYMATNVESPAEVTMALVEELKQGVVALEVAMRAEKAG